MLSPREQSEMIAHLMDIYATMELELLKNIASRLKGGDISDMAQWQMRKLQEMGWLNKRNAQTIKKYVGYEQMEIAAIMEYVLNTTIRDDETIYQLAFGEGLVAKRPVNLSAAPAIQRILDAAINNCRAYCNLVNTRALEGANKAYCEIVNRAYLETATGLRDYQSSIRRAVADLAQKGITGATYSRADGRTYSYPIDAAIRRNIITSTGQTAAELQLELADEMGCNYVEVTSHKGARPSHALWQGQVYQLEGSSKEYKNFAEATRYGEGDGLCGWNCRHNFYPFFPGLSERVSLPYDIEANEQEYQYTQQQRALERDIRASRRECVMAQEVEDDEAFAEAAVRLKAQERRLSEFIRETERSQTARVSTHGFDRATSRKAIEAERKVHADMLREVGGKYIPKDIDKFRELQYTDNWKDVKSRYKRILDFKKGIADGTVAVNIRWQKQQEHIRGSKKWLSRVKKELSINPHGLLASAFYEDVDLELLAAMCGMGRIDFTSASIYPTEYLSVDHFIGIVYSESTRSYHPTNRFGIRYSSKGIHMFPVKEVSDESIS